MRLASYLTADGVSTWGAEHDGSLFDLGPTGLNIASSLREAISADLLPIEFAAIEHAPALATITARFLPVIPDPAKILCIGVNYRTHQDETGRADASAPVVFTRFADTLAGAGEMVSVPKETQQYDYEGELAIVIGAHADHVSVEDAWGVVAGYAIFNDLSARDWQRHTGQWVPGKNFAKSGPFGPYFVPSSDVDDITTSVLETRVNGELRQHAAISDLIFSIPEIIEYCTTFTSLAPGDVIVTGTPGGVGLFRTPPTFLSAGDTVEVQVTGIGVLSNTLS